jgi:hypothetical protein
VPPAELIPSPLPERVWWERVGRAAKRRGTAGSKIMSDWSHDMLRVLAASPGRLEKVVDGHWQPTLAEHGTEEYVERETRRLKDELGRTLGVGPMP